MVTVFLRGGLGNQMFQYALGLALARRNRTELVLDTVFLQDRFPRRRFTYRTYDLDIFTLAPAGTRFTRLSRLARAVSVPGLWLGLDLFGIQMAQLAGAQKWVTEKSDRFEPAVLDARGNLLLFGRWQSAKYFTEEAAEVRAAFRFGQPLAGEAEALAAQMARGNSVAVHVRRGDYAALNNVAAMMGETNVSYYERAAAYIGARVAQPEFFFFSDDIDWCRQNIKLPFPAVYVPASAAGPKASFHLRLMSLAKHNIIANSSFSWWGAWLNENHGKIVVAPARWYADGRDGAEDIVPAGWARI